MSLFRKIALEAENVDGATKDEIEFAIYGKMTNSNLLQKATEVIKQKQSSLRGVNKGTQVRVRYAQNLNPRTFKPIGKAQYILTAKAPSKKHDGLDEVSSETTSDMLNVFLSAAGEYMEKTRFVIPETRIESADKWEIDVFYDSDGSPHEWVKIDLEVSDSKLQELKILPDLGLEEVIIVRAGVYASDEEKDIVSNLYKDYFTTKYK